MTCVYTRLLDSARLVRTTERFETVAPTVCVYIASITLEEKEEKKTKNQPKPKLVYTLEPLLQHFAVANQQRRKV